VYLGALIGSNSVLSIGYPQTPGGLPCKALRQRFTHESLTVSYLRHHFFGEIAFYLFYAFANLESYKAAYASSSATQQLTDGLIGIFDEGLTEQGNFPQEFLDLALYHFLDDISGLPFGFSLRLGDIPLLGDRFGRNASFVHAQGFASRDMHGDIPTQLLITADQLDKNTDPGSV
jgi:hypothetical protein